MKRRIVVVVVHPEHGRIVQIEHPQTEIMFLRNVFVPMDDHPLGGWIGEVKLYRRVNLRKDEVPRWHAPDLRPMYEFVQKGTS